MADLNPTLIPGMPVVVSVNVAYMSDGSNWGFGPSATFALAMGRAALAELYAETDTPRAHKELAQGLGELFCVTLKLVIPWEQRAHRAQLVAAALDCKVDWVAEVMSWPMPPKGESSAPA